MFKEISSTVGCEMKCNRQFPSCLVPLFQSESKCETILVKVIDLHENKTACRTHFHMRGFTLRHFLIRGTRELGNGLFCERWLSKYPACKRDVSHCGFNVVY